MGIRVTGKGLKDVLNNSLENEGDKIVVEIVGEKSTLLGTKKIYEVKEK